MYPYIHQKNHAKTILKGIFILFFLLLHARGFNQCTNSSVLSGGTFVNDNTIPGSDFLPASLPNVGADDGSSASASILLSLLGSGKTNYLKATGFGFTIPASATICGVSVSVKKRAVGINLLNWISDEAVRLVVGGTVTGNNIASGTHWSGTAASVNYGSASDTWGATLTPADVNSSNFGVAIAAKYTGVLGVLLTAEIDYITIQVSYNYTPVPLILGEYNTHISGNLVSNKWTMYEEEENGKINLLRSYDGKNWNNIETISAHYHIGEHKYEFIDSLYSSGTYYYRLELIHATGRKTYSRINTVNYKGESKLILYPNPATDFIRITNVLKDEQVNVFTIDGQRLRLPVNYENGMLQLTVKPLKRGTYFIVIGKKRFSLIKQ